MRGILPSEVVDNQVEPGGFSDIHRDKLLRDLPEASSGRSSQLSSYLATIKYTFDIIQIGGAYGSRTRDLLTARNNNILLLRYIYLLLVI